VHQGGSAAFAAPLSEECDVADTTNSRPSGDRDQPGDESMTDAQRSYLKTLSDEAGEEEPGRAAR